MKKTLLATLGVVLYVTTADASYLVCKVIKDTAGRTRPEAPNPSPKMSHFKKGEFATIIDSYKDCRSAEGQDDFFAWIPKEILGTCSVGGGGQ
jgi:hypothetical protein